MKYVEYFDSKLLWLNLRLLLFIVLLPFSTALYVGGQENGAFVFYCLNIVMLGTTYFFLIRRIFADKGDKLSRIYTIYKWEEAKNLTALLIWLLAAALSFFLPLLSRVIFVLIFVIEVFINRKFRKKLRFINEHQP